MEGGEKEKRGGYWKYVKIGKKGRGKNRKEMTNGKKPKKGK